MKREITLTEIRTENTETWDKATALYEIYSNEWVAERQLLTLETIAIKGLPTYYTDLKQWLDSYYENFLGTPREIAIQLKLILDDSRFKAIEEMIKTEFDHDLAKEFLDKIKAGGIPLVEKIAINQRAEKFLDKIKTDSAVLKAVTLTRNEETKQWTATIYRTTYTGTWMDCLGWLQAHGETAP